MKYCVRELNINAAADFDVLMQFKLSIKFQKVYSSENTVVLLGSFWMGCFLILCTFPGCICTL